MFKYVSDVSLLSHNIIKEYITTKDIAVDATLGNGYDCDFLSNNFKKVYAFEIQKRVKKSVESMTGLTVTEVNVHVQGVKTEKEVEEKEENEEVIEEQQ